MTSIARRELATRHATWAKRLAAALARTGATPNSVSLLSMAFAAISAGAFAVAPNLVDTRRAAALLFAAAAIQLRLLCNLLDGMLAIEQGLQTPAGALFNEIPDRVADVLILAGAGYSIRVLPGGIELGWLAATSALFTAYIRQLGGALTGTQLFIGPMAKQQRMFVLTMGSVFGAIEAAAALPQRSMFAALTFIAMGSTVTAWRRIARIVHDLEETC